MKNKITYPFRWICNPPAIAMRNLYGNSADYILLKWNYFGDPSLAVIPNDYPVE